MTGAALILAAGASERMGTPKWSLPFGDGTFLSTILERLAPLGLEWTAVVVGPGEAPLEPVLRNLEPESGPIGSIRIGLDAGADRYPWLMVALVDHPTVRGETYVALAEAADAGGGDLWAPSWRGRRGHPVVFGRACYEDLRRAPADRGARWVVERHRDRRVVVEVHDPGVLRNVNRPEDYRELLW